jgi:hypothetical protein
MGAKGKPINFSRHAAQRMLQRGAMLAEVEEVIRTTPWQPAQRGKWHARHIFPFDAVLPVNGRHYAFKTPWMLFSPRILHPLWW